MKNLRHPKLVFAKIKICLIKGSRLIQMTYKLVLRQEAASPSTSRRSWKTLITHPNSIIDSSKMACHIETDDTVSRYSNFLSMISNSR